MLFTYEDVQPRLNIDLSNPNGQTLATTLIAAVQGWATRHLGYPIEAAEVIEYFEEGLNRLWLATGAPVSALTIDKRNSPTDSYETVSSSYVHNSGNADVYVGVALPSGFQSVRATYTTGWTSATVPADLKDALIELVGLKIQEVTNYSSNPDDPAGDGSGISTGALKRVQSGSVTLEYASNANDAAWKAKAAQLSRSIGENVPAGILATIEKYRRPVVI